MEAYSNINEISASGTRAFIPLRDSSEKGKKYNISLSIRNDFAKDTTYYLRNAGNGYTILQITDSLGNILSNQSTGYYIPIRNRFGKDEQGFLPITIKAGKQVNIQLEVHGFAGNAPVLTASLYTVNSYYQFYKDIYTLTNTQENLSVLFVGAVFIMMVFFWFMYLKSKQALYGRYSIYLTVHLIYGFLRLGAGTGIGYLTLQIPLIKYSLIPPIILVAVGGYAWFIIELLDLRKLRPSLFKLMKWVSISLWAFSAFYWVLCYIMPEMPYQTTVFLLVRIVLVLINLYILFSVALFVKSSIKNYYIIGNTLFLIFGVLAGIKEVNNIFTGTYFGNLNNANWYMIGILLECIFFAFALGVRIKELEEEKDDARQKLIDHMQLTEKLMQETNLGLENKVAERTAEILAQKKQLEEVTLQETKVAYEKQLSETKMQALRSRMNPHFLFNSLNSIKYFILKNENDTAAFYLNKFAKLLRHILEYSNNETISLQQELDTLKLYLEIESLRFDKSFHYDIRVDEGVIPDKINIPPLILQPFVENAIWHGLANSDKYDKFCNVEVVRQNGHILISIKDNGVGRAAAAIIKENKINKLNSESFGMKITEERMELFNTTSHGKLQIAVQDEEDEEKQSLGTTINITLQNTKP